MDWTLIILWLVGALVVVAISTLLFQGTIDQAVSQFKGSALVGATLGPDFQ